MYVLAREENCKKRKNCLFFFFVFVGAGLGGGEDSIFYLLLHAIDACLFAASFLSIHSLN